MKDILESRNPQSFIFTWNELDSQICDCSHCCFYCKVYFVFFTRGENAAKGVFDDRSDSKRVGIAARDWDVQISVSSLVFTGAKTAVCTRGGHHIILSKQHDTVICKLVQQRNRG